MDDNQFERLLTDYLDGKLEEHECRELLDAVEASPDLRSQFQAETRLHVLLRESMSEQVEVNLIQESVGSTRKASNTRFLWLALANAAALLIAAGFYFAQTQSDVVVPSLGVCVNVSGNSVVQIERGSRLLPVAPGDPLHVGDRIVCDPHARALMQLQDGSMLSLNKGATLTLVSDRPEVRLERGQALFEVAERKDGALPFQVHTAESTVNVMGTVFGLADVGQTELEVYEGLVTMTRHRDRRTVEVGMQQTASTGDETFVVRELPSGSHETLRLVPTDDITLQNGKPTDTDDFLQVEGGRRKVYLRFEIPAIAQLKTAKLLLTQEIDTGSGRLQLHLGDHSDWTETSIRKANSPVVSRVLDEHRGVVMHGQVVEFELPTEVVEEGAITFVLTLNKSKQNDIWFSSREGASPPQLVLSAHLDSP